MTRVGKPQNGTGNGHAAGRIETTTNSPRLHRLGMVRTRERISRKAVAFRLGVSTSEVKSLEAETTDMPLSALYTWQEVLGVPAAELLAEPGDSLSPPVWKRAELVRLMKTALAVLDRTQETPVKHLTQTMINQLIEIMPELRNVGSWPRFRPPRGFQEYGRTAERSVPDNLFSDHERQDQLR